MNVIEREYALEHITVIVDTREQQTIRLRKRLKEIGFPFERKKLNFGDYSAKVTTQDGSEIDFSDSVAVERKMSLDELAACYCKGRGRFAREFDRAKKAGAKLYLLVENGSFEQINAQEYRSRMTASALRASVLAWLARYDCQLIFCKPETTGKLIGEILYREIKERLEAHEHDSRDDKTACDNSDGA